MSTNTTTPDMPYIYFINKWNNTDLINTHFKWLTNELIYWKKKSRNSILT